MPETGLGADDGFGSALRRLRGTQGLSLAALAQRVHYSKGYLSKVETGERAPTYQLARHCDDVLEADGALACLVPGPRLPRVGRHRPAQLPAPVPDFTGRRAESGRLAAMSATQPVIVITGLPGVGKTALAVHWSNHVHDRFPDGCLFADLRGYGAGTPAEPGDVLDQFLRALDVQPERIPPAAEARAALLRTMLHRERMLLVLDNAATPDQVRPLLPGAGGCLTLVTSRSQLPGLTALDGAARLRLRPLRAAEAITLIVRIVGEQRVSAEPAAAAEIVSHCGHLPLALRLAAERAQSRPALALRALAAQLSREPERLDMLATADDSVAVRTAFWWSYRAMAPAAARMFRLLSLYPGQDIGIPAAAALAGITAPQARRAVEALAAANLLEETSPDRFRFHDLIRGYAQGRAAEEDSSQSQQTAVGLLLAWYLHTARAADRLIAPQRSGPETSQAPPGCRPLVFDDYRQALAWFDAECANLPAIAELASSAGHHAIAWQLPHSAWGYFNVRKPWGQWLATAQTGLASARAAGDPTAEAAMLSNLSAAYSDLGRYEESRDCTERALEIRRAQGDRRGECSCLHNMGVLWMQLRDPAQAIRWSSLALVLSREIGNDRAAIAALTNLGEAHMLAQENQTALGYLLEALQECSRTSDRHAEAHVLDSVGTAYLALGVLDRAADILARALTAGRDIGDRHSEATTLLRLAGLHDQLGEASLAQQTRLAALAICEDLGDPRVAAIRALLATGD